MSQSHKLVAIRAGGTIVHTGDKLVSRGETWTFVSVTHPRKVYVENVQDTSKPLNWPNRTVREYYASVFNLGIYDVTAGRWTFEPSWGMYQKATMCNGTVILTPRIKSDNYTHEDAMRDLHEAEDAGETDKFPNSAQDIAELEEMDREAPLHHKK